MNLTAQESFTRALILKKTADDAYPIKIAVAGLAADDISVEVNEGALIIAARKARVDQQKSNLYKGIVPRAFEKQFQLADHVRVVGASYFDEMLHLELKCEVPEALKPRHIEIAQALSGKTVN